MSSSERHFVGEDFVLGRVTDFQVFQVREITWGHGVS
jgi:hypothetical protein